MGHWGSDPWDNDSAADWFIELFRETRFAEKVGKALRRDIDDWEVVRAAAYVLIRLGRVYVWPIERLHDDLRVAIARLEEMAEMMVNENGEDDEYADAMRQEMAALAARLPRE